MTRTLAAMLALACICTVAAAQPLDVPRADAPPVLDGSLDDAAWADVPVIDSFTPPGTLEPATEPTEARLCHDGTWLYVGFLCRESDPAQIVRTQTAHDGAVNLDDSVEVFIVPAADRSRYYHFLLSANNIRAEQQGWPGRTPYRRWDTGWRSATAVTDDGWVAEIALPLSVLGGGGAEEWYFNLCRNKRTEPEQWSCVAPVARTFNELDAFPAMQPIPAEAAPFAPLLTDPKVSTYHERDGRWGYELTLHAENMTGQPGELQLDITDEPLRGESSTVREPLALGPKDQRDLEFFVPASVPSDRAVTLRLVDETTGELRQWLTVADTTPLSPLSAFLDLSYYSTEEAARAVCEVRAPEAALDGWSLVLRTAEGDTLTGSRDLTPDEQMLEVGVGRFDVGEHALEVVLLDAQGEQVGRRELLLTRLEPTPNEVKIDRVRGVALVDGEPFFPLGMLAVDVEDVPDQAEAGFNTVSSFAVAFNEEEDQPTDVADAAQVQGMKLVEYLPRYFRVDGTRPRYAGIGKFDPRFPDVVEATVESDVAPAIDVLRDHPALIAYYGIDEPAREYARLACQRLYDGTHAMDPHHPLLVLFSSWTPEEPGWESTMDLVGVDPYMQMGHQERTDFRRGLVYMAIATERAKRFADDMNSTLWIVPQAEYYSGSVRPLLPREQTCQTWVAMIYGARGLLYFRNPVYHQASWANFHEVARRVRALMPALLTRQPDQQITYLPPEARAFDYPLVHACVLADRDGTPVILAANTESREADVRFGLDGLADGATIARMFGEAKLSAPGGAFEDSIEPYGVRAYRLVGQPLAEETRLTVTIGGPALTGLEEPQVSNMPAPEDNLLPGGGALDSAAGWEVSPGGGGDNESATVEFVERPNGEGRCLHIVRDNDFGNACIISDWITLEPNTRYRYGCEMRGTITLGTGRISMMMIGEDGHSAPGLASLPLQASSDEWQTLERTIATGDDPVKLRVWLSLYRVGGEGWWDNVFVEELGPAAPTRNLLANSSFEHAVLEGWPDMWWPPGRVSPRIGDPDAQWTQDFDEAWDGECSMRTTKPGVEGQVRPYSSTTQGPEAKPGETYCFSVYLKADRPGVRATLRVGDGFETFDLTTEWQRYHVVGTFGADSIGRPEKVWVGIYCQDEGTYWADAAQVEAGEEPTEWVPDQFPGAKAW